MYCPKKNNQIAAIPLSHFLVRYTMQLSGIDYLGCQLAAIPVLYWSRIL